MALTAIGKLKQEHGNMRRVLALIRIQLNLLACNANNDLTLLGNSVYYMRKYPAAVQHPKEDAVFSKLLETPSRAHDAIRCLLHQHQELYVLEDRIIDLTLGTDRSRAPRLLELGYQYLLTHAQHIQAEERDVFPEALHRLIASDWKRIHARFRKIDDPLFGARVGQRYRRLHDSLMHSTPDSCTLVAPRDQAAPDWRGPSA